MQVTPYFHPAPFYGGPPRSVYELSKALVKIGHNVTVVTTDAYDRKSRHTCLNTDYRGIKILRFRNISNFLAWNQHLFIAPSMIDFVKENMKKFDIIHLHEYRTFQEIIIHHYSRKLKVPYIIQPRGIDPIDINANPKRRIKKIYDTFIGNKIIRDASMIFALNRAEKLQISERGIEPDKIKLIPNGISSLPSINNKRQYKKALSILFLGRLDRIKGIDILVNAFALLSKRMKNVKLIIAGPDCGMGNELRRLVSSNNLQDKVIFTGYVDGIDKFHLFKNADVFVLPSRHDTFPLSALEAASFGLPVIISDKCYISEWDLHNELIVISKLNEKNLSDILFEILNSDKLINEYGKRARSFAERFTWENIAKMVASTYLEVLNRRYETTNGSS
jgi:glycosyltransferase involved in cell wall biosynthesis